MGKGQQAGASRLLEVARSASGRSLKLAERLSNVLILPQPARACMTRPSPPTSFLAFAPVQSSAGEGLEIIMTTRRYFRLDDNVQEVTPQMRGMACPLPQAVKVATGGYTCSYHGSGNQGSKE
jgi:hypothetical protein